MKQLLLTALLALSCLTSAQAQDRSAYSFKVTPHVNQEDELIDSISRASHVRHLSHTQRLLSQDLIGIVAASSAWKRISQRFQIHSLMK